MDTRIRLIVEGQGVNETTIDLKELLNVQRELVKATNDLRLATEKKSSDAVKATKEEIGIINNLKSSIAELTRLRDSSLNTADVQRYNSQLKSQQDELSKLTSIQKQQTVLSKEQNAQIQALTANTGQSNSMFKTLLTTMGALFAVDKVLEYSKAMLDNTINTQRLDIALKNISASNADYSASMEFLNKTSDKYGQNVNNLKESYIQFIAASKNSNLSMIERQKIYESVIQAGSTLQLSSEKVERALNAVSQMFSKGNVSAEELRQQLGEHIPGAFGMMAQALGVNEKKLNKMLEQGEVLAKDALPKLGKVLTETYGEKAQSNLETVAGQQNRALNSLTEWLKRKNEDLGVTNKISGAYKYLADNFDSLINVITSLSAVIALNTARKVASNAVDQIKLINLGREVLAKQAASTVTLELTAAETAAAAAATKFNSALSAAPWGIFLTIGAAALTFLLDYTDAQRRFYELSEEGVKTTDESIKMEKAHGIELGNNIESIKKLAYGNEERIRKVNELMKQYPQYFQNLTAEQVSNWHLKNAYEMVNKEIQTKITLMAREKSIEKTTDRLATIKMELESMGVMVNSVQEYYKVQKEQGSWFALNAPKATALLREQAKLEDQLRTTSYKLSDAKINQMNIELRANKAMYESKQITLEQFKTEANRIQDTYGIKVKYYNLQKTEPPKIADIETKSKKESLTEQEKLEKETSEYIKDLKEKTNQAISEIENRGEEERAFEREKWLDRVHKIYVSTYEKIKQIIDSTSKETKEASEKYSEDLKNRIGSDSEEIKKRLEEHLKLLGNAETTWKDFLKDNIGLVDDLTNEIFDSLFSGTRKKYEEELDNASTYLEKFYAEQKLKNVQYVQDIMNTGIKFASGDIAEGIAGLVNVTLHGGEGQKRMGEFVAAIDDMRQAIYEAFLSLQSGLEASTERIKIVYAEQINQFATLDSKSKETAQGKIDSEIKYAEQIQETYKLNVSNESDLHQTKLNNIDSEYNEAVKKINDKYNLEKSLADTAFGAASLAIQEQTNQQLIALLKNQDTRLSLDADYNAKRFYIFNQYASQIKDITPEMSQVEIDGINAAIQARDNALSEVEKWLQEELKFVLSNEEQKRKEYSATEKIIKDGEDAIEALRIEYNANELERLTSKNLAIEAAEKTKNANIEIEAERHTNYLKNLELEKDAAILQSFNNVKELMKSGYEELSKAALDAYRFGKIGWDEYLATIKEILYYQSIMTGNKVNPKNINLDFTDTGIPAFNLGTEKVGGKKGVDKNLALLSYDEGVIRGDLNEKRLNAGLNMNKTIEYAVNFKSMLDNPGFMPLQLKSSILPKLEERAAMQYLLNMNMVPVVDELREVKQALSKIPIQNFTLDENGLNKFVKKGNSVQKLRKKRFE